MDYKTAVLEGCKLSPMQIGGQLFQVTSTSQRLIARIPWKRNVHSCVNGAALIGFYQDVGKARHDISPYHTLRETFPILSTSAACPVRPCSLHMSVLNATVHLNDSHDWTREAIAEWVDTL